MQLPFDFKALVEEMANIGSATHADLAVSVYIDEKAPADVVAHVRNVFASDSKSVRLSLSYLDRSFNPHAGDDIAVIVAGSSRGIGAAAAAIRAVGTPALVVSTMPVAVTRLANSLGHDIPEGDLVSPTDGFTEDEPVQLTDELAKTLDVRIARWLSTACKDKHLSFAVAFPALRRPMATSIIQATSLQNAGIGLVPFLPGADMPVITLNQAKMVLQIAACYGQEMDKNRLKEMAAVLGGAYVFRTLARELIEFVPVFGFIVRTGVAYGGTSALGHAVIEYFEGGQDASGVANVASKLASGATNLFRRLRDNPKSVASDVRTSASRQANIVRDMTSEYAPVIRDLVEENVPKARDMVSEYAPAIAQVAKNAVSGKSSAQDDTATLTVQDGAATASAS